MAKTIQTGGEPPPMDDFLHLRRLRAGESCCVRICSEKIWHYWSHYDGKSRPCPGARCQCKGAIATRKREWHGVLHVFDPGRRKEYFLEITSHCWILLQDQLPECDSLRGLRVTFTRSPGADNGRLRAKLDAVARLELDLPAGRNPNHTFEVIWKRQDDIDPLSLTA